MNKKEYRIVKAYPNSPSVGKTISWSEYDEQYIDEYCVYYSEKELQNTEFFEEVVEKNYEILEITSGKDIYRKNTDGKFYNITMNGAIGWYLKNFDLVVEKISKVKRLTDNIEISLGDKLKLEHWKEYLKVIEIKFENNTMKFHLEESNERGTFSSWYEQLELVKEPKIRFTTEDNHVVYEGESFEGYYITYEKDHVTTNSSAYGYWSGGQDLTHKYFKSQKAANDYIDSKNEERLLDSKVLSINDFVKAVNKHGYGVGSELHKELKELVRSKQ